VQFKFLGVGGFAGDPYGPGTAARAWRVQQVAEAKEGLARIRQAGLEAWSSMDIFVVPRTIFDANRARFTAGSSDGKRIALNNFTLSVAAGIIDEVFDMFPSLDGVVIRVGENYGGPPGPVRPRHSSFSL
jgi:hypothetical protein